MNKKGIVAGIIKVFLFLFSLVYGALVELLVFLKRLRPYRLPCTVISVGNITLGGTGKTVLVEYITRFLRQTGHRIAIVTRGYKRRKTQYAIRNTDATTMGDEPYMLFKKLGDIPLIVDANRIRGAKRAIKDYAVDTVILDDGFQQWHIHKDLEIVTIDATHPFGNRHTLPRGILREPLASLRRAQALVLTKTDLACELEKTKVLLTSLNPSAEIFEAVHTSLGLYKIGDPDAFIDTGVLQGKTVTIFCGIGDPQSFEQTVKGLGVSIGLSFRFFDHHEYSRQDLERIVKASEQKKIAGFITTEKDAARLEGLGITDYGLPFYVLRIGLTITKHEDKFHLRLHKLYSA